MSAVFVTLAIGIFNLGLGYALAVRLGYGPPSLLDAWDALAPPPPPSLSSNAPAPPATEPEPTVPAEEPVEAAPEAEPDEPPATDPPEEELDGVDDEVIEEVQPPEAGPEMPPPADPENWEPEQKGIELSLTTLNVAIMKSGAKCTELDTRLRAMGDNPDEQAIRGCIEELKEDCEVYLAQVNETGEQIGQQVEDLGELQWLSEELEITSLEQAAQIETSLSNLAQIDLQSDSADLVQDVLKEIGRLRLARHKLRDEQMAAFATIARHEDRLNQAESELTCDELTELPNRLGLEAAVNRLWKEGTAQSQQIGGALFNIDALGPLNDTYGSQVADKILQQVARMLQKALAEQDILGRFTGGSFLLLAVGQGPQATTKNAERLRQTIEKACFLHGEQEIRITASIALMEIQPDDSEKAVYTRLTETLDEAKRDGPNRSFFHDGTKASQIESPNLGAEATEIVV